MARFLSEPDSQLQPYRPLAVGVPTCGTLRQQCSSAPSWGLGFRIWGLRVFGGAGLGGSGFRGGIASSAWALYLKPCQKFELIRQSDKCLNISKQGQGRRLLSRSLENGVLVALHTKMLSAEVSARPCIIRIFGEAICSKTVATSAKLARKTLRKYSAVRSSSTQEPAKYPQAKRLNPAP